MRNRKTQSLLSITLLLHNVYVQFSTFKKNNENKMIVKKIKYYSLKNKYCPEVSECFLYCFILFLFVFGEQFDKTSGTSLFSRWGDVYQWHWVILRGVLWDLHWNLLVSYLVTYCSIFISKLLNCAQCGAGKILEYLVEMKIIPAL